MADELDLAFETEQQTLTSAIEARRHQTSHLHPVGVCHYCDSTVGRAQLFCDSDCADSRARLDKLRRNAGLSLSPA